jgi:hypothetical protein
MADCAVAASPCSRARTVCANGLRSGLQSGVAGFPDFDVRARHAKRYQFRHLFGIQPSGVMCVGSSIAGLRAVVWQACGARRPFRSA